MSLTMLCAYALLMTSSLGLSSASILWLAHKLKTPRWFFWGLVTGCALGTGTTAAVVWTIALSAWTD